MFAYYFPPCNCWPTASERSLGFAKGLRKLGWHPVVITRSLASGLCRCEADPQQSDPYRGFPEDSVHVVTLRPRSAGPEPRQEANAMGRFRSRARLYRRSVAGPKHRETSSDWVARAIEEGEAIIADQGVDAVWTTSGPASSVTIGNHFDGSTGSRGSRTSGTASRGSSSGRVVTCRSSGGCSIEGRSSRCVPSTWRTRAST